jgi:hypothetical protein
VNKKREQQKVSLLKEAEAIIDELLDWEERTERPNLSAIEGQVLELRQRLSEKMAETVIAGQEAKQLVCGPACPRCGKEMHYKGQKVVKPRSWVGELEIERGYYYCAACREGFFPPG